MDTHLFCRSGLNCVNGCISQHTVVVVFGQESVACSSGPAGGAVDTVSLGVMKAILCMQGGIIPFLFRAVMQPRRDIPAEACKVAGLMVVGQLWPRGAGPKEGTKRVSIVRGK